MAPEVINGSYDHRADWWSVGVIMYECLVGVIPFNTSQQLPPKDQTARIFEKVNRKQCTAHFLSHVC